ncbi:systemin isoform X5 [Capsicum annuum]
METPSYDIKNKGGDVQEKTKVEHDKREDEKEKIIEKETPSQDIGNKGDDAQEKPKVEREEGGDEIEKIVENETSSQISIKIEEDDAQDNIKVEYEEAISLFHLINTKPIPTITVVCNSTSLGVFLEEDEKEKTLEKATPPQDINNKGEDAQEKPTVEHKEDGDEKEKIVKGDDALEIPKVEYEEREEKKKVVIRVDLAVHSTPPSKRPPPKMQTDNNKL